MCSRNSCTQSAEIINYTTNGCCTHSLLHAQQDALTQYKDILQMFTRVLGVEAG
jgi:hypothetical protein